MSDEVLCDKLGCTKDLLYRLFKGYVVPTVDQLDVLTKLFGKTTKELLAGDIEHYEASVVHYMNEFKRPESREKILDIIENYSELATVVD